MQSPFRSPLALLCFFLTAAIGITLDLWTKSLAFSKLALQVTTLPNGIVHVFSRDPYPFIPGWLEFEVTANQGAVFGMGQGRRILFIAVSAAAILFLIYLFAASGKKHLYQVLLGMLTAGVVGNLYDRITLGYVRDMIHALPRWPSLFRWIFNVADSMLCVGVTLMIFYSIWRDGKEAHSTQSKPRPRQADKISE